MSQEWVGVQPGTLGVLALGLAYVLIRNDLYDTQFVSTHLAGFEDTVDDEGRQIEGYRSVVLSNFRTEEVSAVTGVPVERIIELARGFAATRSPVAVFGSDVTRAPNGLQAGMAVHSLNLLMGSVRRPGGVLLGLDPPLAPLATVELDDVARAGLANAPAVGSTPTSVAGDDADRFAEAVANGDLEIDTLLLYHGNPLASSIHPEVWRAALDRIRFVVSFSPFLDETTQHIDLIIPDLLPLERWQDAPAPVSYPFPVWGITQPLVEPPVQGTHTGDVILAVARRLGGSVARSLPYENFQSLLMERARGLFEVQRGMLFAGEFEDRHHRQMEERGWWLQEYQEYETFWQALLDRGGWTDSFYDFTDPSGLAETDDGRIDLMPGELLDVMSAIGLGGRIYDQVFDDDAPPTEEFPYRLIPYKLSTLNSGTLSLERWVAETPGLFPGGTWYPWVEVNPAIAQSLGLDENAMVWVISEKARIRARLKLFSGTAPGNVCVPYGLQHPNGELANPLQLLTANGDPLTGSSPWATSFVRLEPAPEVET
jgi:anaerobic selenocysteine-containing dehydrogenase